MQGAGFLVRAGSGVRCVGGRGNWVWIGSRMGGMVSVLVARQAEECQGN